MQAQELYQDIVDYCQTNADDTLVQKYSRYFTEGYDAYGLSNSVIRSKVDAIISDDAVDYDLIIQTGDLLVKSGKYEETFFAIILLKHYVDEFTSATFQSVGHWFETGIVNWAHCDVACRDLTGIMLKNKIVDVAAFAPWRTAANQYQRRAVPVSLIEILKETDDLLPLLNLIEPLMEDPEKKVQQGLGWFLREAWKLQKEPVEKFLLKWKNTAPRTIYQYACEKMSKDEKLRFRKEKK